MEVADIKKHWQNLAETYRQDLQATTKTRTIKVLEIDALDRALRGIIQESAGSVLEVGCGNGHNCIALAKRYPKVTFTGIDYIPAMIEGANILLSQESLNGVSFHTGDVLNLSAHDALQPQYDVVFTVRCIINLPKKELQHQALSNLAQKVKSGGSLVLSENFTSTYNKQNKLRQFAGLQPRTPDPYNLFIDEESFNAHAESVGLRVQRVEDFGSLHDLLLYVLLPAVLEGKIEYEHPLMHALTKMLVESRGELEGAFGSFGQNRLYHYVKSE